MVKIGYARVSTEDQNLDLQLDALNAAGCEKIFTDSGASGTDAEREGLSDAIAAVDHGDVLVVWKLDRLGRSLSFLIDLIEKLKQDGAAFKSLSDGIDTTTPGGKLTFHIIGALAEFERSLISERTKAGLKAAARRGKFAGRPRLLKDEQLAQAAQWIDKEEKLPSEAAAILGVKKDTFSKALKRYREEQATD